MSDRKLKSIIGPPGPPGKSFLSGTGVPAPSFGNDDDFYLDYNTYLLYGPKVSGDWGSGASLIGPPGSGGGSIPEVTADPASPANNDAWVLCSGNPPGEPLGLLLALTSGACRYFFSYKTFSGAIVRTELT